MTNIVTLGRSVFLCDVSHCFFGWHARHVVKCSYMKYSVSYLVYRIEILDVSLHRMDILSTKWYHRRYSISIRYSIQYYLILNIRYPLYPIRVAKNCSPYSLVRPLAPSPSIRSCPECIILRRCYSFFHCAIAKHIAHAMPSLARDTWACMYGITNDNGI